MKVISSFDLVNLAFIAVAKLNKLLKNWLEQTWQPKITQKSDRNGNIYFQIYDPMSRQYFSFASEREIRFWLEERYR